MKAFPMFIRTSNREVVVVGGGEEAAAKARLIAKTDARLRLIAAELEEELAGKVASGAAVRHAGPVTPESFRGTALTFIATGCAGADMALHALAKAGGALVNVVDRPDLCDATTPSIVDRDPVVIAIGTEGTAPVLARSVKTQIEQLLAPGLGRLAALAGSLRGAVAQSLPRESRRAFWAWTFRGAPARLHREGHEAQAEALLRGALLDRQVPEGAGQGHIAVVGAGPGAADLLTLRAVERLQEADVIFYQEAVDARVLELARRDARREPLGRLGRTLPPQVVEAALSGQRVVYLGAGADPVPGADVIGVTLEHVPGVAAPAAQADMAAVVVPLETGRRAS